ncbi:MAG: MutS-related protein, partial [Acidobacteriota bacterium]
MTLNSVRHAREVAFQRQIERLDRRIQVWQVLSNRISWVRVAIALIGIVGGSWTGTRVNEPAGWVILVITLMLFTVVAWHHRRVERWIGIFRISRNLKSDQLARMNLHWEQLPAPVDVHVTRSLALDLDLTGPRSLHQLLDTTISRQGGQRLADWLVPAPPDLVKTDARQRLVRELVPLTRFRERFWLTFRLVLQERLEGDYLLQWLAVAFPSRRFRWALVIATALVALNLFLFILNVFAGLPPLWAIPLAIYAAFYLFNQALLGDVFRALLRMDAELDRFRAILHYLETTSYAGHPALAELCAPFREPGHSPSAQIRRIKIATAGVGLRSNPVLGLLLNLVLPWDFLFAFLADHYRAQVVQTLPRWVHVCYELDALLALANFAYLNPGYTFPELAANARPVLLVEGLGHPLIPADHRICNDFSVDALGQVAIITGSNMAGKSTFIKTVGTNLCLGYAGAPVCAERWLSVPFRLHTCIRITDSIVDGFSYFYAEVKCLKALLNALESDDPLPLLYLIDEIFRGTNNRERLLGSRAFIRALVGKEGIGLLATHDLELA